MGKGPVDFTPWGLEATWPSRRWLELVDGRRDGPPKGVWLGHASESAMVLVCTYPRPRFDAEMPGTGADLVRELAAQRLAAGLSQTEVAARMGTSQSAVARLESGATDARASTLERYAAAIGGAINWSLHE